MGSHLYPGNKSDSVVPPLPPTGPDRIGQELAKDDTPLPQNQETAAGVVVEKIGNYAVNGGAHSDIWKANLKKVGVTTLVALKVLRAPGADRAYLHKRLEREVKCWKPLSHKNIAPFYGVHHESNGAPALMLPWYEKGSADVYLRNTPSVDPIEIIKGISEGVEYLHGKGIVHGDLKGANVMINDNGRAVLIDFGLARLLDSAGLTTSFSTSLRWCAPELLLFSCCRTTKSSDVYAFASTALELLTGHPPYDTIPSACVPLTIMNGTTPSSVSSTFRYDIPCAEELWWILECCWVQPALRPRMSDVRRRLWRTYP